MKTFVTVPALILLLAATATADYTKIANNGWELPASALLGSGAFDWACTRDNATGLVWEVKTDDGSTAFAPCAGQPANTNVVSLALVPDGRFYAGTEAGVFVSADNCATWATMNSGLP